MPIRQPFSTSRGVALILTLAMVTMLAFLVVAFFSRTVSNRLIEYSSTSFSRADILAKSASETIISDLRAEIIAGSAPTTASAVFYQPLKPLNAVPALVRAPSINSSPANYLNLVKQSVGRFYPAGADYPNATPTMQTTTGITTEKSSVNNRTFDWPRWVTVSMTLGVNAFSSTDKLPQWVLMTRDGIPAAQSWDAGFKDYAADNKKAAIGRFAFNIYDEGGMLDINVAGYPDSIPSAEVSHKGSLALAQLDLIPGIDTAANAKLFIETWRNLAAGGSRDDYLAYLGVTRFQNGATPVSLVSNQFYNMGPRSGFTRAAYSPAGGSGKTSDNRFLGRQDLIRLAAKQDPVADSETSYYGINDGKKKSPTSSDFDIPTKNALPYLTHFTREANAPSWGAFKDASDMGGNNGPGTKGAYSYKTYANEEQVTNPQNTGSLMANPNRFLPNVRVSGTFTRLSGEQAVTGDPLIQTRFPLSWLALLQDDKLNTTAWDLSVESTNIVNNLEALRKANGAAAIPGTTINAKAAWLVEGAFGLKWGFDRNGNGIVTPDEKSGWSYVGSSRSVPAALQTTLKAITSVAGDNREPNFFELLKGGILNGSLGNSSDFESFCINIGEDSNPDYQVMQIGANIVDQADADSYPTLIAFGYEMDGPPSVIAAMSTSNAPTRMKDVNLLDEPKIFAGLEDLPFIHSILFAPYRQSPGQANLSSSSLDPNQNTTRDYFNCWLQFVLWKPQQVSPSTNATTDLRVLYTAINNLGVYVDYWGPSASSNPPGTETEFPLGTGIKYKARDTQPPLPANTTITFTDTSGNYRAPTVLGYGGSSENYVCSQTLQGNGGGGQFPRGMWLGETLRPEKRSGDPTYNGAPVPKFIEVDSSNDSRFELQFKDGTGTWRTYQRFDRFGVGTTTGYRGRGRYGFTNAENKPTGNPATPTSGAPYYADLNVAQIGVSNADPRSQRYGLMAMFLQGADTATKPASDWSYYLKQGWAPESPTPATAVFGPSNAARFTPSWTGGTDPNPWGGPPGGTAGGFIPNSSPILDPTAFFADNPGSGSNYYKDRDGVPRHGDGDSSRNVRPMQLASSTTANTSDLGLILNRPFRSVGELSYVFRDEPWKTLDLRSPNSPDSGLLDVFSASEEPRLVAGKVNLNTRNAVVLQALISGAAREEFATNTISAAEAKTIADRIVANTSDTSNAAETGPLRNASELAGRLATILPASNNPNDAVKSRREVVQRALGGSGQTRTWNLLVDVIAQSGRFSVTAASLDKFIVEGEKRYWLHVAIDRSTGRVIDQQMEPVAE